MRVRRVKQIDCNGCGLACVATVTGYGYRLVRSLALASGNFKRYGMSGSDVARTLQDCGRPVQAVTMGRKAGNGRTAIVKVTAPVPRVVWRKGKAERRRRLWQHWVVWLNGRVWDPGYGVLWTGAGETTGMDLYLASVGVKGAKTGRWHWL